MSVYTSSWLARMSGVSAILARPSRVRVGPVNGFIAAVFDPGSADELIKPGSNWILENGSIAIPLKTLATRKKDAGSVLVFAGERNEPEG